MSIRVFISQPMRDRSELDIDRERRRILDWVPRAIKTYYIVEIPKLSKWQADSSHPVFCLGHSLQNLSRANVAIFAPGWVEARGCRIEHEVCEAYRIPFVELDKDDDGNYVITRKEEYADDQAG